MLQFQNLSSVTVCAGVSSSGKSTFAIRYMLNAPLVCRFIFDPRGEYEERLGFPRCSTGLELELATRTGWVLFNPHAIWPGRVEEAFSNFCEWVFHRSEGLSGQKVLFVDEVWRYCSPNSIPLPLAMIVQDGRKNGLGVFVCSQRPNRINEAILNEAGELIAFQLRGTNALRTMQKYGDFDPDELKTLPKLHFVAKNLDSGGELAGRIEF
jgi:hypothetical protein